MIQEKDELIKKIIDDLVKDSESKAEKRGPLRVYKSFLTEKLNRTKSLIQEKKDIEKSLYQVQVTVYKKFNFFEKHIFKRKEYKQYIKDREIATKQEEEKRKKAHDRLKEIDRTLLTEESKDLYDIERQIERIEKTESFNELGIQEPKEAIDILINNDINPEFESFEQAIQALPEVFTKDVEFMKEAVKSNPKLIIYDKTDDEELYKIFLESKIEELEKDPEKEKWDYAKIIGLESLKEYQKELESPKKVEKGKYKIPHKYLFEEIRFFEKSGDDHFSGKYLKIDGLYDEEFGKELQELYERPDLLIGIHGLKDNKEIEEKIFRQGLKNSTQSGSIKCLDRTVLFGKDLIFTNVLRYGGPGTGMDTPAAIILTLPYNTFDKSNPAKIWGSNEEKETSEENFILPQYVYGVYHASDGENKKIIKNELKENEKETYKYLFKDVHALSKESNKDDRGID